MVTPVDAWVQGGAALTLVVFVTGVIAWLVRENSRLRSEISDLHEASEQLLKSYQSRDVEELMRYRDQERRRRDGGAT